MKIISTLVFLFYWSAFAQIPPMPGETFEIDGLVHDHDGLPRKKTYQTIEIVKGGAKQLQLSRPPKATVLRAAAFPQPKTVSLTWGYPEPLPAPGVAFQVERTEDFVTWTIIGTTNAPPFTVSVERPFGFFRVGTIRR